MTEPQTNTGAAGTVAASAEPAPPQAVRVFGERFALAQRYAALLCTDGVLRGLIGPREPARIWRRHLLNGAALAEFIPADADVLDVGSGAGLPGIPLALARPDLHLTLVEPLQRRATFLTEACQLLEIDAVVLRDRAENLPGRSTGVVVARAVAPLPKLLALTLPLLRPGGLLLALKGGSAEDEVAAAADILAAAGVRDVSVHAVDSGEEVTTVVRVVAPAQLSPSSPRRRTPAPTKRQQAGRRSAETPTRTSRKR